MVITDKVSSADDIARGFLSGEGLAAGLVAISSKNLKPKDSSILVVVWGVFFVGGGVRHCKQDIYQATIDLCSSFLWIIYFRDNIIYCIYEKKINVQNRDTRITW